MNRCSECKKYFKCHLKKENNCPSFEKKEDEFFFTKLFGKETNKEN